MPSPAPPAPPDDAAKARALLHAVEAGALPMGAVVQNWARLGPEAAPVLAQAFPGKVTEDPLTSTAPGRTAQNVPALVELVIRLGPTGLPAAHANLGSRNAIQRYFAFLVLVRSVHPSSVQHLMRGLHDDEPRIREMCGAALTAYADHPSFDEVLAHLRGKMGALVPESRRRAIQFLGRFRDPQAVPLLIDALEDKDASVRAEAEQSLCAITLQAFGNSGRKWKAWWKKHEASPRMEWLLDGLMDEDVEVRWRAAEDLAEATGESFGYSAVATEGERAASVRRWHMWWVRYRAERRQPGDRSMPLLPSLAGVGAEAELSALRNLASTGTVEQRTQALRQLTLYRDVEAVPLYLRALEDADPAVVREATDALQVVGMQLMGSEPKAWAGWWKTHQKTHRVEWLLEALSHGDMGVRTAAIADLTEMSGSPMGYSADNSESSRAAAVARYRKWWAEEKKKLGL